MHSIIHEMEAKKVEFSPFTYHILAYFYGLQGQVEYIERLIEKMRASDMIPDHLIF